MVASYREANGAVLYSSTGVNMGGQGALAFWLQEVIQAVSGNLDRRGGTLVGQGIVDFPGFAARRGILMSDDRSRIGGIGKVNDAFAGGILADEILTPGDRQVRALFVTGGNPLMTMPRAGRLREAFRSLDLLVVVDLFLTETASEAHWVLPATSPLERADLPFIFPLMLGMQRHPYLQATRAVVPPPGNALDEGTIYHRLARACGVGLWGSKMASGLLEQACRWNGGRVPEAALLSGLLRLGGQGSFRGLLSHPHGRPGAEHQPGSFLGKRVLTDSGRVVLADPELVDALGQRLPVMEADLATDVCLRLITRRETETHNSGWTRNTPKLSGGQGATNHLYMHPDDARRLGIEDGSPADVRTPQATVRLPVRYLKDLMPGTVAIPHGWGHQHAAGLSVSGQSAGANVNLLPADGPDALDSLSGMARLTGIPVDVAPAAAPINPRSWSGL
jgi:formate dehydrogenase